MISMKELLGTTKWEGVPTEHQENLTTLLEKLNKIRVKLDKIMIVSSGYRSIEEQARINPKSPKSGHLRGECADIYDPTGELRNWVLNNMDFIVDVGFWFEDFRYTKGWVHFSIKPPKSGKRIFIPYSGPIPYPELWDGIYKE
jgi:hypothetical protein